MGFRFALAAVLRVRESIEKHEEIRLESIQLEVARVRRAIDELAAQIEDKVKALQTEMQRSIPSELMQLTLSEIDTATARKQDLFNTLAALQQKQKEQLKKYSAAHRARQILSDMRAQKLTEYNQRQERTQQKLLDDIFTARRQHH